MIAAEEVSGNKVVVNQKVNFDWRTMELLNDDEEW